MLEQVDEDQRFSVLGRNAEGTWLAVCCAAGQQGWAILNPEFVQYGGDVASLPIRRWPQGNQTRRPPGRP